MKRELSYREEMVQQLHIVRGEFRGNKQTPSVCIQCVNGWKNYGTNTQKIIIQH